LQLLSSIVCFVLLNVTTSSGLKETSKLWRLLVERDAGNKCTDVLPAVLFIKIFHGGLHFADFRVKNAGELPRLCHFKLAPEKKK
jgi:hypothetical protein